MAKTIAFYVRKVDPATKPFAASRYGGKFSPQPYQEYLLAMKRRGVEAYFVSGNDTYLGGGRFARGWDIDRVCEVGDFKEIGEITAGVIFDKGGFEGTDLPVVTDARIRKICDKAETFRRFGDLQPKTVICSNPEELKTAIAAMPGDMVVVKNPAGDSGDQVYIAPKAELVVPESEEYPLLVQEFVDMSDGIPGLVSGIHDLRLLIAGGTIIGGTVRQAVPGRFHANTGQGGSQHLVPVDKIPEEVKAIAAKIDAELGDLPRYYSIDFARGKQGFFLIELNAKPTLYYQLDDAKLAHEFRERFVDYIVGLA